jgi:hypothetical protein
MNLLIVNILILICACKFQLLAELIKAQKVEKSDVPGKPGGNPARAAQWMRAFACGRYGSTFLYPHMWL